MKAFLALVSICSATIAAPLPPALPVVKRPAPLLSPRHASAPKVATMAGVFSQASELPKCPMTCGRAYTENNEIYFVVAALKRRNMGLIMEFSTSANGPWTFLAGWGAYPEDLWVSGIAWTAEPRVCIRAVPGVSVEPALASAKGTTANAVFHGRFIKLPSSRTKPIL